MSLTLASDMPPPSPPPEDPSIWTLPPTKKKSKSKSKSQSNPQEPEPPADLPFNHPLLSHITHLFHLHRLELSAQAEEKEALAEKVLQKRLKALKAERAEERRELVEMIREMALGLEEERASGELEGVEEPIVMKDAVGRRFVVPWERGRRWKSFSELIKEAFAHIEVLGPQVAEGYYDIVSPKGFIVLPSVWDNIVEPGWEVSMHMWPLMDNWKTENQSCGPPPPPPPPRSLAESVVEGRDGREYYRGEDGDFEEERPYRPHRLNDIVEKHREGDSVRVLVGDEKSPPKKPGKCSKKGKGSGRDLAWSSEEQAVYDEDLLEDLKEPKEGSADEWDVLND